MPSYTFEIKVVQRATVGARSEEEARRLIQAVEGIDDVDPLLVEVDGVEVEDLED